MPRRLPFLLPLLLSTPLLAQGWSGTLQDGRRVEIDPASNRAIEQAARGGNRSGTACIAPRRGRW
ncbi:MAG: hypothetical protein AB2814_04435 [Candidatus Sedimenticola endophacoides]